MCCLKNEEETYEDLNRRLPNTGDYVTTPDGMKGEVHSVNVLRQRVKVIVEINGEKEIKDFQVEELKFKRRHHKDKDKHEMTEEEKREMKELERMERQDANGGKSKLDDN